MIILRPFKRPCEKQIYAMSRTGKGKNMPNWKEKWSNNFEQRKKDFTPNQNFGHNNSHNLPNR